MLSKLEIFEKACELLEVSGHTAEVRAEYSGRAMYGATTPGLVVESCGGVLVGWAITVAVTELGGSPEDAEEFLPERRDNMGLGTIYY